MLITSDDINALAAQARLKITKEELPEIIRYMDGFLTGLERMKELELNEVPIFSFTEIDSCPMREDNTVKYPYRDDIMAAAPDREGDYYRAARILEE